MCSYNNWCYVYRDLDLTEEEFDEDEFWEEVRKMLHVKVKEASNGKCEIYITTKDGTQMFVTEKENVTMKISEEIKKMNL